jgi:hypothetical protein
MAELQLEFGNDWESLLDEYAMKLSGLMADIAKGIFVLCDKDSNGGCTLTEIVDTVKEVGKPVFFMISDSNGEVNATTRAIKSYPLYWRGRKVE